MKFSFSALLLRILFKLFGKKVEKALAEVPLADITADLYYATPTARDI